MNCTAFAANNSGQFCIAALRVANTWRSRGQLISSGTRIGEASNLGPRRTPFPVTPVLTAGITELTQAHCSARLVDLDSWLQTHRLSSVEELAEAPL